MADIQKTRKTGQAMSVEEYTEKLIKQICRRWYKKGFRDGAREKEKEQHPEIHYCRDCEYLAGDKTSIGIRCLNENRRRNPKWKSSDVSRYKAPSTKACKTGFKQKQS